MKLSKKHNGFNGIKLFAKSEYSNALISFYENIDKANLKLVKSTKDVGVDRWIDKFYLRESFEAQFCQWNILDNLSSKFTKQFRMIKESLEALCRSCKLIFGKINTFRMNHGNIWYVSNQNRLLYVIKKETISSKPPCLYDKVGSLLFSINYLEYVETCTSQLSCFIYCFHTLVKQSVHIATLFNRKGGV